MWKDYKSSVPPRWFFFGCGDHLQCPPSLLLLLLYWRKLCTLTTDWNFSSKKKKKSCRNCDNLPPSYHQLAVGLEIREIRQTGLATAGQLMSSQFNHCVGSWGSWKFIYISLNGKRLLCMGSQNGIGWGIGGRQMEKLVIIKLWRLRAFFF